MKNIVIATFLVLFACNIQAQDFKFGIQVSPFASWLSSNSNEVVSKGANIGLNVGMVGEYYFAENYAFVAGASYLLNQGGAFEYANGGNYLPNSTFSTSLNEQLDILGLGRSLPENTTIAHRITYFQIPIGFKMRTNELGGTYLKGFAQLPMLGINIATSGRADIKGTVKSENETTYPDVVPLGLSLGAGAGVEYYPNDNNLGLVGGIFFNGGLINAVRNGSELKYRGLIYDITLRIGVLF